MIEPHRSDTDLLVLHMLRCLGFASTERLHAAVAPLETIDVEDRLLALASQGLVTRSPSAFGGWGLTDAGRSADAERIAVELERADARNDVEAAYDDFLALNQTTLNICGDWQVRRQDGKVVLNDHTDHMYDDGVLARLAAVDSKAQVVCSRLAGRLHRFSHYGPRLASALDHARHGHLDQVTDSLDSYHTLWFQLHEDLLVTLGISRKE